MGKFLYIVALVLSCGLANVHGDEMPGQLIDDLMKKTTTAEGALPSKHEDKKDIQAKNPETQQPVFSNSAPTVTKEKSSTSLWGRMITSLVIVLTLFGGAAYVYRKWPNSKRSQQKAKMIEILNQQYLGPKKSIAVIRVAGEAILIGVTDNQITHLKDLSLLDDDIPAETKDAQFSLKTDEERKFQKTLGTKIAGKKEEARDEDFSMQGLKELIGDKLKNMREI